MAPSMSWQISMVAHVSADCAAPMRQCIAVELTWVWMLLK